MFSKEDLTEIPTMGDRHNGNLLTNIKITEEEVLAKLTNLTRNKSPGPYDLHEMRNELVDPLLQILNKSIEDGVLPAQWKTAHVTALHKKNSARQTRNYRPISLTCMIMDSIIRDHILAHMTTHSLFHKDQHGLDQADHWSPSCWK